MEKNTEKLAGLLTAGIYIAIAFFILKFFGNVVGYIVVGLVVALLATPLKSLLAKIRIRGKALPASLLAAVSILLIMGAFFGVLAGLVPVFKGFVNNLSYISTEAGPEDITSFFSGINSTLKESLHLDEDFSIEALMFNDLSSIVNVDLFENVLGTVASTFAGIVICIISAFFIAFFLVKDDTMFSHFVITLTPEKYSTHMENTVNDVKFLLSRYFVGLVIEMTCIGVFDFMGLWLVAGLDVKSAVGIGFLAGLLNIIPYIGPLLGATFGTLTGIMLKFCSYTPVGIDVSFWVFVIILVSIFILARFLDNFVLMPVIYSTSIKAHPLEIFIVILVAGSVGGIVGMLLAMPAYTVLRVIIINFFPDSRTVKLLK